MRLISISAFKKNIMQLHTTRIWAPLFCILAISSLSCKKFLSSYSQNNSFIETEGDLDELLVGTAYYNQNAGAELMHYAMDDDAQITPTQQNHDYELPTGWHYWQAEPRLTTAGKLAITDVFYNDLYSRIAGINTILHNVAELGKKTESSAILKRISGEAHYLRAAYYFMLVNLYGKPYRTSTATTDFGIPLKTEPAIKDQFVSRNTTGEVHQQILKDLLDAEQELAGMNRGSTIRASQQAAQALLSRVYLFMEEYENSSLYADKVIDSHLYEVKDLNNHTAGEDFLLRNSPEVIFTMGGCYMSGIMDITIDKPTRPFYRASEDLALSYSSDDLRLKIFLKQNSQGYYRVAKKRKSNNVTVDDVSDMFLVRLSEMYLNKAEALAALGRSEEARTSLQELREKRFQPGSIAPVSEDGAALVQRVRDERRMELCFEGHRWFDLRRYAVNSKYPFSKTIRHRSIIFTGNGYTENGYYELGPYEQDAAAYIVPIAGDEIEFNKGLITNEQRPVRPLKQ
jgi:tetratricopeptide (TPR) repeat protein